MDPLNQHLFMSERRVYPTIQAIIAPITLLTASHWLPHTHADTCQVWIWQFLCGHRCNSVYSFVSCFGSLTDRINQTMIWIDVPAFPSTLLSCKLFWSGNLCTDSQLSLILGVCQTCFEFGRSTRQFCSKHLQIFITLPLMNLAAYSQGAAKKCENSLGITPRKHTTQAGYFPIQLCIDVLTLCWYLSKMEYANLLGNAACPVGF